MAANKFATMLHRNTNKISMILIYAVLEWTLIVLLLLNSLFSHLIIKFSEYFGLKPPCLWCSRLDHIFEGGNNKKWRNLLCEAHAKEVSGLGYCLSHQKLAESHDMCEDCLSSRPEFRDEGFTFFGMVQTDGKEKKEVVENGHHKEVMSLNCSCCGVTLDSNISPSPHIVIRPSWGLLESAQEGNFISEAVEEKGGYDSDGNRSDFSAEESKNEIEMDSDVIKEASVSEVKEFEETEDQIENFVLELEENRESFKKDQAVQVSDASVEIHSQHLEFFIDCSSHRLVPVELIDSATEEDRNRDVFKDEDQEDHDDQNLIFSIEETNTNKAPATDDGCRENDAEHSVHISEDSKFAGFESMEIEEDDNSLVFYANGCPKREADTTRNSGDFMLNNGCRGDDAEHSVHHIKEGSKFTGYESMEIKEEENSLVFYAKECPKRAADTTRDSGVVQQVKSAVEEEEEEAEEEVEEEDVHQVSVCEDNAEVSIGTEIPDLDSTDEMQTQEDPSTSCEEKEAYAHEGADEVQEQTTKLSSLSVELNDQAAKTQSSFCLELNESEEVKAPDTPTSLDSPKDFLTHQGVDGMVTVEQLRTALRAERKALVALYSELEEERNASAIAANQTMAMITRLQEEKAAMQMEALQYQRMMEEQAEYDQEAMQLLNELMVKREREKEELEKELEIYRKRVLEYETRERLKMLRRSQKDTNSSARSGFSSPSCSNAEDSDAGSIDLNQDVKEEDEIYGQRDSDNENSTPVNAVMNLEESVADFEDERLSILEQLKVLEEKLMTLDHAEIDHFEDENGNHVHENGHSDGPENGFANGKCNPEKRSLIIGSKGKSLLPLFDATSDENGEIESFNGNGFDSNGVHCKSISPVIQENKRVSMEEELDHLYERLQALEADREFLKHCIGSLNKGEKGMHLLHEILHHLRDLRSVDLRARSFSSDGALV